MSIVECHSFLKISVFHTLILEDEIFEHKSLSLGILNEAFHDSLPRKKTGELSSDVERRGDAGEDWVNISVEKDEVVVAEPVKREESFEKCQLNQVAKFCDVFKPGVDNEGFTKAEGEKLDNRERTGESSDELITKSTAMQEDCDVDRKKDLSYDSVDDKDFSRGLDSELSLRPAENAESVRKSFDVAEGECMVHLKNSQQESTNQLTRKEQDEYQDRSSKKFSENGFRNQEAFMDKKEIHEKMRDIENPQPGLSFSDGGEKKGEKCGVEMYGSGMMEADSYEVGKGSMVVPAANVLTHEIVKCTSPEDSQSRISEVVNNNVQSTRVESQNDGKISYDASTDSGDTRMVRENDLTDTVTTIYPISENLRTVTKEKQAQPSDARGCCTSNADSTAMSLVDGVETDASGHKTDGSCKTCRANEILFPELRDGKTGLKVETPDRGTCGNTSEVLTRNDSGTGTNNCANKTDTGKNTLVCKTPNDDIVVTENDIVSFGSTGQDTKCETQSTIDRRNIQIFSQKDNHRNTAVHLTIERKVSNSVFYERTYIQKPGDNPEVVEKEEKLTEKSSGPGSIPVDSVTSLRLSSSSSVHAVSCFCGGTLFQTSSPYRPKSQMEKTNLK